MPKLIARILLKVVRTYNVIRGRTWYIQARYGSKDQFKWRRFEEIPGDFYSIADARIRAWTLLHARNEGKTWRIVQYGREP